jgi:DNA polymerase I
MKKKGIAVGPGSLIKFVIIKGEGKIRDKVKLAEDAKQEDYDPEYYINNQIMPSVGRIFDALGIEKDELSGHGDQKKLGSFI